MKNLLAILSTEIRNFINRKEIAEQQEIDYQLDLWAEIDRQQKVWLQEQRAALYGYE